MATNKRDQMTQIAREHLDIPTLEPRHMDSLDFHNVGVVGVARALDAAYRAGQADLLAAAEALLAAKDRGTEVTDEWHALSDAVENARRIKSEPKPWQ